MAIPPYRGCSIRALWISNQSSHLVFSRRFVTVERQWRQACEHHEGDQGSLYCAVPFDAQVAQSFGAAKLIREGRNGSGAAKDAAVVDDPISRYVTMLKVEGGRLWPVVEHRRGACSILVLPMVEPHQMAAYEELCSRADGCAASDLSLSALLLDMPCITGSLAVAQAMGDVLSGDLVEPELFTSATATMGGLLDSITGGMGMGISGIAARAKPVAVPVAAAANAVAAAAATATSAITGGGRVSLKSSEKDALRSFIASAMPFGTPLDLNSLTLAAVRSNGFTAADVPVAEQRQPMWKPYLYRGKQRMAFAVHEVVTAALYDRDDVEDSLSLAGEVLCRLDLEGLPEVALQLLTPATCTLDSLTFHLCAQAPEQGADDKHTVTFTPPLGSFVLARYTALPKAINPPLQGFYQLSMVSEAEGAFLIRMRVMAGYKSPMVMEQCSLSIPFPRRKIVAVEGTPSVGTVSTSEHSIEWRIVIGGRGLGFKSTEVTFPGTVKFAPDANRQTKTASDAFKADAEFDAEIDAQESDFSKGDKGEAGLTAADMEEPLCWEAYSFAKASIKLVGGTMSGISIDPKTVSVYPAVKTPPCELSAQVVSGEYIFWNSLGRYPHAVPPTTPER